MVAMLMQGLPGGEPSEAVLPPPLPLTPRRLARCSDVAEVSPPPAPEATLPPP